MSSSIPSVPTQHYWINPDLLLSGRNNISDDNNKDNNVASLLLNDVECLCIGTGRFLRAVLIPLLQHHKTVIVQPRGRSFLEFMQKQQQHQQEADHGDATKRSNNKYPVDTVLRTGQVETEYITCAAAFSWGRAQDKQAFYQHLPSFIGSSSCSSSGNNNNKKNAGISILGLGVTEAGLASHETPVMQELYQLFQSIRDLQTTTSTPDDDTPNGKICVIDMDNVPNNGSTIQQHMLTLAEKHDTANDTSQKMSMKHFFKERVAFLNTMVDRITSQRKDDAMIPRAEPVPAKALVVLDPDGDLPSWFTSMASSDKKYGLVIRSTAAQLETDVALKLRVANGTHTAIAHVMALLKLTMTDSLSLPSSSCTTTTSAVSTTSSLLLMDYLDSLARDQILVAAASSVVARTTTTGVKDVSLAQEQAMAVWEDWRLRLTHPHFGLSTFFITQNGPAKGGIRLTPTIIDLIHGSCSNKPQHDDTTTTETGIHVSMAFCFAVLLRWLTPMSSKATATTAAPLAPSGVFTGWLPKESSIQPESKSDSAASTTVTYADGLQYNLDEGWYQFRCDCQVVGPDGSKSHNLSEWLAKLAGQSSQQQPAVFFLDAIQAYLRAPSGGNQESIADTKAFAIFSQAVATLYSRMVAGDCLLAILQEMKECKSPYTNGFASDCSVLVLVGN